MTTYGPPEPRTTRARASAANGGLVVQAGHDIHIQWSVFVVVPVFKKPIQIGIGIHD